MAAAMLFSKFMRSLGEALALAPGLPSLGREPKRPKSPLLLRRASALRFCQAKLASCEAQSMSLVPCVLTCAPASQAACCGCMQRMDWPLPQIQAAGSTGSLLWCLQQPGLSCTCLWQAWSGILALAYLKDIDGTTTAHHQHPGMHALHSLHGHFQECQLWGRNLPGACTSTLYLVWWLADCMVPGLQDAALQARKQLFHGKFACLGHMSMQGFAHAGSSKLGAPNGCSPPAAQLEISVHLQPGGFGPSWVQCRCI